MILEKITSYLKSVHKLWSLWVAHRSYIEYDPKPYI